MTMVARVLSSSEPASSAAAFDNKRLFDCGMKRNESDSNSDRRLLVVILVTADQIPP